MRGWMPHSREGSLPILRRTALWPNPEPIRISTVFKEPKQRQSDKPRKIDMAGFGRSSNRIAGIPHHGLS